VPFYEPGLEELFNQARHNLTFQAQPEPADVFLICVPTPLNDQNQSDLSYVKTALQSIVPYVRAGNLVITESTIPPSTHRQVIQPMLGTDVRCIYTPERALVGNTLQEMRENDRIIGADSPESGKLAKQLYSSFVTGNIHITDINSAEIIKLIENAYRDANIAFVNELAKLCDQLGSNIWEIIRLANLHPRVNLHQPGPGVGGHCLPIDPWFLIENKAQGSEMVRLSRQINDSMPDYIVKQVAKMVWGTDRPMVTILGVAYKANVDDTRETPALKIAGLMMAQGWQVKFHDPLVKSFPHPITRNFQEATQGADCLVLVTNHTTYSQIDPTTITGMHHKNIYDCRNFIDPAKWEKAGFKTQILGKP